ncbi:uncharacterized protein PG998_004314 [Apiospora kogelbergensis]|uniref:uncharacterized protein n=1 Tax=Apiospora kogelbergensis TaxID=1337665 RepID=UPI00313240DE
MHLSAVFALLSAAATAVNAAQCSAGKPPFKTGELSKDQFTAKGRRYRVHLPAGYDPTKPTPVILSYHGAHGTIEKQCALDQLTDPARNRDYIVVYLQALVPQGSDKTEWQVAPGADKTDDVGFTADVLAALDGELCVDPRRVYATGKSQGGGFVGQTLACDATLSERFAAFAPVAGAYYIKNTPKDMCEPTSRVAIPCATRRKDTPVMAFHGGADPTIPYRGTWRKKTNSCLPDIRHWAREWAVARDGLQGTQHNTTIPGSQHGVRSAWRDERVVLVYAGDEVQHDWPSTTVNSDNKGHSVAAFNASDDIIKWFGKWKL